MRRAYRIQPAMSSLDWTWMVPRFLLGGAGPEPNGTELARRSVVLMRRSDSRP